MRAGRAVGAVEPARARVTWWALGLLAVAALGTALLVVALLWAWQVDGTTSLTFRMRRGTGTYEVPVWLVAAVFAGVWVLLSVLLGADIAVKLGRAGRQVRRRSDP